MCNLVQEAQSQGLRIVGGKIEGFRDENRRANKSDHDGILDPLGDAKFGETRPTCTFLEHLVVQFQSARSRVARVPDQPVDAGETQEKPGQSCSDTRQFQEDERAADPPERSEIRRMKRMGFVLVRSHDRDRLSWSEMRGFAGGQGDEQRARDEIGGEQHLHDIESWQRLEPDQWHDPERCQEGDPGDEDSSRGLAAGQHGQQHEAEKKGCRRRRIEQHDADAINPRVNACRQH